MGIVKTNISQTIEVRDPDDLAPAYSASATATGSVTLTQAVSGTLGAFKRSKAGTGNNAGKRNIFTKNSFTLPAKANNTARYRIVNTETDLELTLSPAAGEKLYHAAEFGTTAPVNAKGLISNRIGDYLVLAVVNAEWSVVESKGVWARQL